MAISLQPGSKGGRRSLTAELNLVPYIDLLTCMVAFLLITAVWTQLAQLNVQGRDGKGGDGEPPMTRVVLLVGEGGFNLAVNDESTHIGKTGGAYDFVRLDAELKKLKSGHPDKDDIQVASEDSVLFEHLTRTMDAALAAGFPLVSLLDSGSAGP